MENNVSTLPSLDAKIRKAKMEYVSSENNISAKDLADSYVIPVSALSEVMKAEKWDSERDAFRQEFQNDVRRKTEVLKTKSSLNTLSQAVSLQNTIFKKVKEDIEAGRYIPTIKDFTEIAKITSPQNKNDGGNVNSNNKIINISVKKPVEEMTYEEILEVESQLDREERNEY
jgi:uncharacterized protein YqfB (UPF0267 family)